MAAQPSAGGRDCTAYCVMNSEGKGHFKYDDRNECFTFRGTGMCGEEEEEDYARDREALLCDPATSCQGNCGGYAGACWCDSLCTGFGDCCLDFGSRCSRRSSRDSTSKPYSTNNLKDIKKAFALRVIQNA